MLLRVAVLVLFAFALSSGRAQQARPSLGEHWLKTSDSADPTPDSAWLDLRQGDAAHAKVQAAPPWVESVSFTPAKPQAGGPGKSVFRIRLTRPNDDCQILFFRLFFDDNPGQQPELIAWDESGSQLLHSGSLGQGSGLATSVSTIVPMIGVSAIDLEVPGNGRSVRAAYLDWMKTTEVMRPIHAEQQGPMPEPFGAVGPLQSPEQDVELFGTVTAPLATEAISIGSSLESGAGFQFGLEAEPLAALLTFEIASPQIDSPPEIYLNGVSIGPASLTLPDLADPGYQGMSQALIQEMRFQYTGWVRAQKIVPASLLKVGANDVIVVAGPGTPTSAVRETQIQLKYLWDKSDYLLQPLQ